MRLKVTHNSPTSVLWCIFMAGFSCEVKGLMHGREDAAKFMISAPTCFHIYQERFYMTCQKSHLNLAPMSCSLMFVSRKGIMQGQSLHGKVLRKVKVLV